MDTQDPRAATRLVRTSILIPEPTDSALRTLAEEQDRPLSRVVRQALDEFVARNGEGLAA